MLTAFKKFLRAILFPTLYGGGLFIAFYSLFKDAWWGFILFIALIPQPNIWYKFHQYPLGKDYMDILFLGVFIGLFVQRKSIPKTSSFSIILLFIFLSYFSLWVSSFTFDLPFPLTTNSSQFVEWKNFAQMISIYFITVSLVQNEEQQKKIFSLMSMVLFFLALRNYRNFSGGSSFSYDKRVGGPFERVGLGATHYGAFIAHFMVAFLGMSFFEEDRKKKLFYLATFCICLHPLFFSYSRGAYIAVVFVIIVFGLLKKRSLLVGLMIMVVAWQLLLPASVVDRIAGSKTESGQLESSANTRILLWEQAGNIITENFIIGVGWEGFGLTVARSGREIHGLTDTHNYYVKTMCDRGVIGLVLLIVLFGKAFMSGLRLYRSGESQFQKGLGFAFMGTTLACMTTNIFGDRFTYFVLGSYFWLLWGLVDRGILMMRSTD